MPGEFEDLEVYKQAREFRKRIWKLTQILPETEKFVLVPQMRRASLSVTNNIAEGHGSWNFRHTASYIRRSRGSMNELIDDINTCEDQKYFEKEHLEDLKNDARSVIKLLNGYIRYLRSKIKDVEKPE